MTKTRVSGVALIDDLTIIHSVRRASRTQKTLTGDNTMAAQTIKIKLSEIANEAMDYVDQVPSLSDTGSQPQIIERSTGKSYIVDGFHRTAGQIRYCRENGISLAEHEITVVLADDPKLIAVAAEPNDGQQEAIDEIYRQAGA